MALLSNLQRALAGAERECDCEEDTKIVTPLKPGRWRLTVHDGPVDFDPSIGNWSAACQSHCGIGDNQVILARGFTAAEIAANRASNKRALEAAHAARRTRELGFWARLWAWIKS